MAEQFSRLVGADELMLDSVDRWKVVVAVLGEIDALSSTAGDERIARTTRDGN